MHKNILQLLENSVKNYSDKIIFTDPGREITYKDFEIEAKKIGSFIAKSGNRNKPVVIFIDKTVNCLSTMFGTLYGGNFYAILDTAMPKDRINLIIETLDPFALITDEKNLKKAQDIGFKKDIYIYEEMLKENINDSALEIIRNKMIDTDPMYTLFTSGSTGVPKGTVICHRSVIAYASSVVDKFNINSETSYGSQTPFYFSMSILDIFTTVISGATFHIIPKMYFSFPVKLLEYLNEKKVNTIYWVPSALSIVANLKALDYVTPKYLTKILFAGEVMPTKQLNIWIKHLPDALYANLYGPTEITDICTYYIVDRELKDDESLPIGYACDNADILIIKEDNTEALPGEEGELCVRGSFLALGYYNNPEKTNQVFVQNPLNDHYPELIYKTGDIVKYNEAGELIYLSRKDFQIKHMGYRIELGEIETAINAIDDIIACACIYDLDSSKIVLYYQSSVLDVNTILEKAKLKLPKYMCPNEVIKLDVMPHNANGKIDRVKLKEMYKED